MDRCPNCMRLLVKGSCPNCGAPQSKPAVSVRGALPCHTMLEARYEIGNPLGSNAQAIAYIAFDSRRQETVIVLEFFPARIVNRSDQQVTMRGRSDLYADACRRFLTSTMAQPLSLLDTFCANNTGYRVYKPVSGMYAVEAELLLDAPILFRNEMDQPVMSINALHIPPMPKQREWTLSRRLTRVKKRRTTRRIIAGVAAVVVLGVTGAVAFDRLREYEVTIQVHTEVPVLKASLGDQDLPEATPDAADHIVTYQTKLRKGAYSFTAENEHKLSGQTTFIVNGPTTQDISIPTPSPAPIVLTGSQWFYKEGESRYVVTDKFEETDLPFDPSTKLYQVTLSGNAALADDNASFEIRLYRDGVSRELVWKNGKIEFEVTAGSYELRLKQRTGDQSLLLKELEVPEDGEAALNVDVDMEALAFYCDNVDTLKKDKQLCYIGGDSNRMISADADQLNNWYDSYPKLFEEYRQYDISIELDEHLRKDASFTLNGRSWMPGQKVSVNAAVEELAFVMTADGATYEETIPVEHHESEQKVTMGKELIAEADCWKDVRGLVIVGGETRLLRDGQEPEIADAKALDQMDRALKLTENLMAHDLSKRIAVSVEQNRFIRPGIVKAVMVNGIRMQEDKDKFSATLTPGEYKFVACFSDGTEKDICTEQIADEQNSTFMLLRDETTEARQVNDKLKSNHVDAMIRTKGGYFLLPAENAAKLENISAEDVIKYADMFTIFEDRWEPWPTEISIDKRVNLDAIDSIAMEGQPIWQKPKTGSGIAAAIMGNHREPGADKIDLQAATAGTHQITVTLKDDTKIPQELHVAAPSEDKPEELNQLILMKDWVDKNMDTLAYWGMDQDSLVLIDSKKDEKIASVLTKDALRDYWHGDTIHKLEVKVEFEISDALSWELIRVPGGEKLPLNITSEEFTLWLPAGKYELHVLFGEEMYLNKLIEVNQDPELPLTLTNEDSLMATPTPSPTPTPTRTPKRKTTPTPTRTPTPKPTKTPTPKPTDTPTSKPTDTPTSKPTDTPTSEPTDTTTSKPTDTPTSEPTDTPTSEPTDTTTSEPTDTPTSEPTDTPIPTATSTDLSADVSSMTSP